MKPRFRPGKPAAGTRAERKVIATAKPLSENQLEHLRHEKSSGSPAKKAGRGGERAHWDVDYEEERLLSSKPMPSREPESLSQEGLRRIPKKGGRH